MRVLALYITLFSISTVLQGQEDTIIFDPIDFNKVESKHYAPNTDLVDHWYWKNYLLSHGKKSILTDTTVLEAYRLIYWGNYFAIVEIIKRENLYYVTADSSSWGTRNYLIYRSQDTFLTNSEIQYIRQYCNATKEEKKLIYPSKDEPAAIDDRDNWAFEFKIGEYYRSMDGIKTSQELESIYVKIMKLGGLNGYRVYQNNGEFNDY